MIDQLPELPTMQPDATAADRVRQRCVAALTRHETVATERRIDGVLFAAAAVYLVSAFAHLWQFFQS